MELTGFVAVLRRWWPTIIVAAAVGGIVAWVVAGSLAPTYESSARLLVGAPSADSDSAKAASQQARTYAEIATTEPLIDDAAESLGLAPGEFDGTVTANANEITRFIGITVRDTDRLVAKDMANAVADLLVVEVEPAGEVLTSAGGVEIREPARLPSNPVEPNVGRIVTLSVIAALILGLGLVLAVEHFDDAVHEPEELATLAGAGFVTTVASSRRRGAGAGDPLVVEAMPDSATASSLRLVATNVELAVGADAGAGADAGSVLVAGVQRGEGSAEIAANLAASLASPRRRVVLVDASPDRQVSALLGVVGGELPVYAKEPTFEHVPVAHGPGFALMTSGHVAGGVGSLGAEDARALLTSLRGTADWVIVHAPPTMTGASTLVWASTVDGAVLVAQRGRSGRTAVASAAETLRRVGAELVGVILNEGRERRSVRSGATSRRRARTRAAVDPGTAPPSFGSDPMWDGPPGESEGVPNGDGPRERVMSRHEIRDVLPPADAPQGPPPGR